MYNTLTHTQRKIYTNEINNNYQEKHEMFIFCYHNTYEPGIMDFFSHET